MTKKHIKTLTAPVTWPVKRKSSKFIVRPKPGKSFKMSMPLALILRDILKYCKTMKEVKGVLRDNEVMIDRVRKKDEKALLGFMDTLSIPNVDEHFRMALTTLEKLELKKITEEESKTKVSKILGKTVLKNKRLQLNLYDGTNLIVKEDKYKIGDSLLLSLPDKKIKKSFSLEPGSYVYLTKGSHVGEQGIVDKLEGSKVFVKSGDNIFETPKEAIFITGKGKSEI